MPESIELTIKSSFFSRPKQLVITQGFLTFGNKESHAVKFLMQEITGIRYGVKGIRGYSFNFGRVYCIDVNNANGKMLKIRFRSFYSVRKVELDALYINIIKTLNENFIRGISLAYLKKFAEKVEFELLGIIFTQDGLLLDKKWDLLPWLDVSTKNYSSYFAVFSMTMPEKYKTFKYLTDWNTNVLHMVSRSILKQKGFWKE
jgi:hypothetical protein